MSLTLKDEVVLPLDTEPKVLCTDKPGHYYFVEFCVKRRVPVRVFSIEKEWYWTTDWENELCCSRNEQSGPFSTEDLALQDIKKSFHKELTE